MKRVELRQRPAATGVRQAMARSSTPKNWLAAGILDLR
jgi:hypothetical protein